ncbi:MAG: replication protein [Nitrospirae bacterium]|nr:replication protein [Nitrospirota bacterium]
MKPFTMIPNDYLEALMKRADLTNREYRVLLQIMRQTYGYRTDKAKLSVRDICRGTDMAVPKVHATLKSLEAKGLICANNPGQRKTKSYSLVDISKIESELIPSGVTELLPTGGNTINKYIYKEQLIPTGGNSLEQGNKAATKAELIKPPPPPLPPQEKKAATKAGISKASDEFDRWIAPINERMNKHFEERELKTD